MARSPKPENPSPDTIVEGTAFEKTGHTETDSNASEATPADSTPPPAPKGRSRTILMVAVMGILGLAAVGGFLYSAERDRSTQQSLTRVEVLDEQIRLAENRLNMAEAALAELQTAQTEAISRFESALSQLAATQSETRAEFLTRLGEIETDLAGLQRAEPITNTSPDLAIAPNSAPNERTLRSPTHQNLATAAPQANQIAASLLMALLADNAAGRPLDRWTPALSAFGQQIAAETSDKPDGGERAEGREVLAELNAAILATPPSANDLVDQGTALAAAMAVAVNEVGPDAGLLERATASLGKLVRLRALSTEGDNPHRQLARFEQALDRRDLEAAADVAKVWTGVDVEGLSTWESQARARLRLDESLASFAAFVIDQLSPGTPEASGAQN